MVRSHDRSEKSATFRDQALPLKRERASDLPVLLPAGQPAFAELQREGRLDRQDLGVNAGDAIGEVDFRALAVRNSRPAARRARSDASSGVMPKASGAVLVWYPQYVPKQTQSIVASRFMTAIFGAPPRRGQAPQGVASGVIAGACVVRAAVMRRAPYSAAITRSDAPAVSAVRHGRFGPPADVTGAEQKLGPSRNRRPICGEVLPRLDQGIAQHRALHQPEAERQHELGRRIVGSLPSTITRRPPGRNCFQAWSSTEQMMRHGVVGQAEDHAVERLGRDVFGGVGLDEGDVDQRSRSHSASRASPACRSRDRRRKSGPRDPPAARRWGKFRPVPQPISSTRSPGLSSRRFGRPSPEVSAARTIASR